MEFKMWMEINEGRLGYILANELSWQLIEGRRDPETLRNREKKKTKKSNPSLFHAGSDVEKNKTIKDRMSQAIIDPAANDENCPITPLSGYETHIKAIQNFAHSSDENFAQTLIFSPLSANVSFAKHWDNFHVLMMLLKHYFPHKVSPEEIEHAVDSFGEKYYSLPMTISGWKLNTISYVWNNRQSLRNELDKLAAQGNDEALIGRLVQIPGIKPVKAGFVVQLLYGRAGCIDTHNVDIYSKAFPDLADELKKGGGSSGSPWQNPKPEISVPSYLSTLRKLQDRGIGTKELWDVWVDFVENFYRLVSVHGLGSFTQMGSAIDDPNNPSYDPLKAVEIPKLGATTGQNLVHVRPISGEMGRGASATHLQMSPDDALNQFVKMYRKGEKGSEAARAIPFRTFAKNVSGPRGKLNIKGTPADPNMGLGEIPSLLRYFEPAIASGEVDPHHVKRIIKDRLERGGKKARRASMQQGGLF